MVAAIALLAGVGCASPDGGPGGTGGTGAGPSPHCEGAACVQSGACVPGQASAQFRAQTPPPAMMPPGTRARASVTYDNCSGQPWTRGEFALVPAADATTDLWGLPRVALPTDVPDGARVTIPIDLIAPLTTGNYTFRWAVSQERVAVLQEPTPAVDVVVPSVADCREAGAPVRFRAQAAPPAFVATGAHFTASVTFANCSTETWSREGGYRLAARMGTDGATLGAGSVPLPNDVPPETEVTVPVELVAPDRAGAFTLAWEIARPAGPAYDEASPPTRVTVLTPADCSGQGPPSRFVAQRAPGTLDPGQTVDASVTFANCSGGAWDAGFHLEPVDGADHWGTSRAALPLGVGDGYQIEVPFQVQAPGRPGPYAYRWTIVHDGAGAVNEPTPPMDVTVRCIPACGDHNCGGDGCGGSCGACSGGATCDGAHCQAPGLDCSHVQWWNSALTYVHVSGGWNDTDLAVRANTPVQIRHDSRLDHTGVYAWGYMPEFTDLVTGHRFRLLHLRPQHQWATDIGRVYPEGFVVGLSGGDTADTGLGVYSTGAHLCVQTLVSYRAAFPTGDDACR